jgi:DegV family protein with EDD domain
VTRILTDSTSDLGADIRGEFGLGVIPLNVTIAGNSYKDGIDLDQERLFELVGQTGELPKTSAPSVGEFAEFFRQEEDILFLGISSKLSATLANASLAAQEIPGGKVKVIDTLNLSTGVGLLALRAAELAQEGKSAAEIERSIRGLVPKVRTAFLIDTMEYLYKGGRCTALQAIAGSVLKIHPIIEVRPDGSLGVREKARGSREKGIQSLLDHFRTDLPNLDRQRVFVTHTGEERDAEALADRIRQIAGPQEVRITRAGSVISSHCGPGTIGILYMLK